jgi:adenylosuccinate synthase
MFDGAICSNGPNSGHTSYFGNDKIVLKQLPTFSVHALLRNAIVPAYLSAGAVINLETLFDEALMFPDLPIFVHPNAAIVSHEDMAEEQGGTIKAVASTQSGTGACIARKVKRDPSAIAGNILGSISIPNNISLMNHNLHPEEHAYFMEIAQGFSLGINSEFYPHVTSRECTVMQGIADARIPPRFVKRVYMSMRTYPIRVGNLDGHSSGGWYDDQEEITWEELGVEPEFTTVTKRMRRVATFSDVQMIEAIRANDPDFIFMNFMNYLPEREQEDFIDCLKMIKGLDKKIRFILNYNKEGTGVKFA